MMSAKPKCPEYVYVGRHEFGIVWRDGGFTPQAGGDQELLGECRLAEGELHISLDQSPSMLKHTVFHECLHAVGLDIDALGWQSLVRTKDFELEEHIVSHYTPVLIDFIAKNPELIKWVTS